MSKEGGLFSIDSPVYKFMSRLLDVLKLNVLWLLTSGVLLKLVLDVVIQVNKLNVLWITTFIPILLGMGASTTAVFYVTLRMVDDEEGYILKPYLKAFCENYKKGTILGVVLLIALYSIYIDFQFISGSEKLHQSSLGYIIVGILLCLTTLLNFLYAFPLLARYENTILNTMRNSFNISLKFIKKTLVLLVVLVLLCGIFLWNSTMMYLGILVGPACIIYTISSWAIQVFRMLENE